MHAIGARGGVCPKVGWGRGGGAFYRIFWFSHDVTKTIDPTEVLLSRCIRAAEN